MPGLIALSENFTVVPLVLNYICFMHIVIQFVVPNFNEGTSLKAKVAYNNMHRYSRWQSVSSMFVSNAVDIFYILMRKNIYGLKKRVLNINNDLIKVMYNSIDIVNDPTWSSWTKSLYTVNQQDRYHVLHICLFFKLLIFLYN